MRKLLVVVLSIAALSGWANTAEFELKIIKSNMTVSIDGEDFFAKKGLSYNIECGEHITIVSGKGIGKLYKGSKIIATLTTASPKGWSVPHSQCSGFFAKFLEAAREKAKNLKGKAMKLVYTNAQLDTGVNKKGSILAKNKIKNVIFGKKDKNITLYAIEGQWGKGPYVMNIIRNGKTIKELHNNSFEFDGVIYAFFMISKDDIQNEYNYEINNSNTAEYLPKVGMSGKFIVK